MRCRPSLSQVRLNARGELSCIQSRARQVARDNQRRVEEQVRTMTGNGARPLSRWELEQIARDSANYIRSRMK